MKLQKLYTLVLSVLVLGMLAVFFYRLWSPYSTAHIDDIWIINLDRDTERWKHMEENTTRLRHKIHRFSAMDGKTIHDRESIHEEGVGYNLTYVRGKETDIVNKGVVGCWLSHKRLLTHLAFQDHQHDYGHLILEDDVSIPKDFLSNSDVWTHISKNIPGDWDMVYLGLDENVKGSPIADNIVKLSPGGTKCGAYAYLVKHGSIKTKLLPGLRFMTDSIGQQYNTMFNDMNVYCIRPSIITLNDNVSKKSSIDI